MDSLKEKLLNVHDFETLSKKMLQKEINDLGKQLLEELKINSFIHHRNFLAAFMVYKFPYDVLSTLDTTTTRELYEHSCKLIENQSEDIKDIKSNIIKFNFCFKKWKGDDGKILKEQLFNEYHQLGVDIMNTDDEDRKTVYKLTRDRILDCSHKVGGKEFIKEIFSYKPVILNKDDLMMQYNKAHNDLLCEEFDKGDYTKTKQLLTFIKNTCLQFHRKEDHRDIDDTIDVDFIINRIKNNAYSNNEYVTLFRYMFSLIKAIQSSSNDELLESFVNEMDTDPVYVPRVLIQMVECIKNLVKDLENLKNEFTKNEK